MSYARLFDVLFLGILQIHVGNILVNNEDRWLGYFMMITGIMNVMYNMNNFLYLDMHVIKESYFGKLTTKNGKTQIHRLYNLVLMYPLFILAYMRLPKDRTIIKLLFGMEIIVGIIYNGYYFMKYMN